MHLTSCARTTSTIQGSCGGCDFTYTAKNPKQAKMYRRLRLLCNIRSIKNNRFNHYSESKTKCRK